MQRNIAKNKRFIELAKQMCASSIAISLSVFVSLTLFSLLPCSLSSGYTIMSFGSTEFPLLFGPFGKSICCLKAELRPAVVGKDQKATTIFAQCSLGKEFHYLSRNILWHG